ncbi:MAG: DUF4288 domain-containing protein [Sphingobacteriales bacterium]|nr:MAG: DUF4288 domain-containing protein [Sphingobacteriales bacterium]
MNWYLAKIVFQIVCGDGDHIAQFDEQLRLINAMDKQQAFEKAVSLGKTEEDSFYNIHQQPVHWTFINVSELYRMEELLDGAEIYSKIKEVEEGEAYVELINNKAKLINRHQHNEILIPA